MYCKVPAANIEASAGEGRGGGGGPKDVMAVGCPADSISAVECIKVQKVAGRISVTALVELLNQLTTLLVMLLC
jgi:hypothetical protein